MAVHFPTRSRAHRIISVPGVEKQLADDILAFLVSLPDKDAKSTAELKTMCQKKMKELMKGQTAVLQDCRV